MARTIKVSENDIRKIIGKCLNEVVEEEGMDIRSLFVVYITHNDRLLQYIVDCETGNQNGTPFSPVDDLISEFEEDELNGEKLTPEQRSEVEKAYNEFWHYAQGELTYGMDESRNRNMGKTIRITETRLRGMIEEAVAEALKEGQGWNMFKQTVKDTTADDMRGEDVASGLSWDDAKKYINQGHAWEDEHPTRGAYNMHYDKDGLPFDPSDNYLPGVENSKWSRPVDTSLRGKVGRAAGLGGALAYRAGLKGAAKAKDWGKEKMRQWKRDRLARRKSPGKKDYE